MCYRRADHLALIEYIHNAAHDSAFRLQLGGMLDNTANEALQMPSLEFVEGVESCKSVALSGLEESTSENATLITVLLRERKVRDAMDQV